MHETYVEHRIQLVDDHPLIVGEVVLLKLHAAGRRVIEFRLVAELDENMTHLARTLEDLADSVPSRFHCAHEDERLEVCSERKHLQLGVDRRIVPDLVG